MGFAAVSTELVWKVTNLINCCVARCACSCGMTATIRSAGANEQSVHSSSDSAACVNGHCTCDIRFKAP